ncbi:Serine/threonine-protein kinase PknD [Rubripirellula obstinata]|uniref:Serine/threonine-protein kinase PknD n=2 Tax=Rubripirellula obstinata TaxID=406547 RepID=A0A5B1CI68_9BACT|nr:Serine/threonine-protein kinase PknD [Rubripirellula obstinata]
MVDPNKDNNADDPSDLEKTTEINSNELTTPIEPSSGADTPSPDHSRDSSAIDRSQEQRKTTVRRGTSRASSSAANFPSRKDGGSSGTVKMKSSLMAGDDIGATINARELTGKDAEIWATVVADIPVDQVVGGKTAGGMETEETIDGLQMESTSATAFSAGVSAGVSAGGQTDETPAIDKTVSDRNFDRLRVCELAPLKTDPKTNSDYRLIRKLGQGGMGDVFVARQGSLDRLLALKLIKPIDGKRRQKLMQTGRLKEVEQERRLQFLSEAIVTGDLDHPNIVPIHDVAMTPEGDLFYSMKRVIGTPWSEQIKSMSVDDNLEVLMRVCDAIAQAHTRGVVHRDIKPENIMLGEFGVVMVMDWGLALPTARYTEKRDSALLTSTGLGGTPAFMSPEMATGPIERIGNAADVYLLGATLFMIVTGKAPHHASTVTECLQAVRENKIREVDAEHRGELLDIAYRAMETDPADRYESVTEFHDAIRDFVRHAGSIQQSWQASQSLEIGIRDSSYEEFSKARYQYEAALRQWSENVPAAEGLDKTLIYHADAALAKEDFDLGLSLLDENRSDHQELIHDLREGKKQRASREAGLRLMKKVAAAMLLFIIVGGGIGLWFINQKRNLANDALEIAQQQRAIAVKQTGLAEEQTKIAEAEKIEADQQRKFAESETLRASKLAAAEAKAKQNAVDEARKALAAEKQAVLAKQIAEEAREDADQKRLEAIAATKRANYEEYVSKIGLAKARLEKNESEVARQILQELKQKSPYATGWEWRWLWRQADGAENETKLDDAVIDLSSSANGDFGAVLLEGGEVKRWSASKNGLPVMRADVTPDQFVDSAVRDPATAVAVSSDPGRLATGHQSGQVVIIDGDQTYQIGAHDTTVSDLKFVGARYLISGSTDRTVRVWDVQQKRELTKPGWHASPVVRVDAVRQGDGLMIAAATSTDTTGSVELWKVPVSSPGAMLAKPTKLGGFRGHDHPVSSVTFSPQGLLVASGDIDGNVLVWNPMKVKPIDYESAIASALSNVSDKRKRPSEVKQNSSTKFARLIDRDIVESELDNNRKGVAKNTLVSVRSSSAERAHRDIVRAIAFDQSGQSIVTASNDYTLKKWNVDDGQLMKKMRGHGGWVTAVQFVPNLDVKGSEERIISASRDQSIRVWNPTTYVGESVEPELPTTAMPHEADISSATFSPDGTRVLTASADHTAAVMTIDPKTLSFRDVVRLQPDRLVEGTAYVAMSMATDDQDKYLFIGSADSTVRIWDIGRGIQQAEVFGTGLNDTIAVSGDGTLLLSGSTSPKIKAVLWKVDPTGKNKAKRLRQLRGHDQAVTAMAVSSDGKLLFTGDSIGYGILWDATTGQPIGPPIENVRGFRIGAAQFASDSRSLWLGADDGQLTQVDLTSRKSIRRLNHDGFVTEISLSRDQQHAVTVSELLTESQLKSRATLWDLKTMRPVTLARSERNLSKSPGTGSRRRNRVTAAAFGKSGHSVVVCQSVDGEKSAIKVWRNVSKAVAGKPDQAFAIPNRLGVAQSAFPLADGRCMTLSKNAAFNWKLKTGKLLHSYRAHAGLTEAAFSLDGKWVATASRSVKLWDSSTGQSVAKIESPHRGPVRSITFQPNANQADGYRFATSGDDGFVRFWKWKPGQSAVQVREYDTDSGRNLNFVRYSSDGKRLLLGGDGGVARILDLRQADSKKSKNAVQSLDIADRGVNLRCGDFSDDGSHVAVGGDDDIARVWKLGQPSQASQVSDQWVKLEGHADSIEDIKIAGDAEGGYRVFTASADDSVKVWDPRTAVENNSRQGREILSLEKHRSDVTAIDLSDDGRLMMTAGKKGQVILWPAQPNEDISDRLFE